MNIDKLDLLSRGWKTSEIEKASQILAEAEDSKNKRIKFIDTMLIVVLGALMLANGLVCSALLVPFIYLGKSLLVVLLSITVGFVFSALFTLIIYDVEKTHHKHETNLFVAYIVNGLVNFYLILEFTARFGVSTKLPVPINVYMIAGAYLIAFLIPQVVYQLMKRKRFSNI
jgi:purine-cytosine permease-like protein